MEIQSDTSESVTGLISDTQKSAEGGMRNGRIGMTIHLTIRHGIKRERTARSASAKAKSRSSSMSSASSGSISNKIGRSPIRRRVARISSDEKIYRLEFSMKVGGRS